MNCVAVSNLKFYMRIVASLNVLLLLGACAPQSNHTLKLQNLDSAVIGGGSVSPSDPIAQSTVRIENLTQNDSTCSGTVLNSRIILTAAHCIGEGLPSNTLVYLNSESGGEPKFIRADKAVMHPHYTESKVALAKLTAGLTWEEASPIADQFVDTSDLGLIHLSENLPSDFAVVQLADLETRPLKGSKLVAAGFGRTSATEFDKLNGTDFIHLKKTDLIVSATNFSRTEFLIKQQSKAAICHGDSGGPSFMELGDHLVQVGIASRIIHDPENRCNQDAAFTLVTAYRDWIRQTTLELEK